MTLEQRSLWDSPSRTELARARRDDPQTSKVAAHRAHRLSHDHHQRIVAALREHGPMCATEIAARVGLTMLQVARRMCELVGPAIAAVQIREGEMRPTASGRPSLVYEIHDGGDGS